MDRLAQEHALLLQENSRLQQDNSSLRQENVRLQQKASVLERREKTLTGSLSHFRNWVASLQARVQQSRFHSDAAKPPRRIYVGGLPSDTTDADLRQYINQLMMERGATAFAGLPISNCKVYGDKSYAFLEFRSVEEASNCMAFDGLAFQNSYLRIRRPNNYDHSIAETLGPTDFNPTINLEGLDIVRTVVNDSPDKIFIGGLPCEMKEDEVKAQLTAFGSLRAFNLVMDKSTGNSKGFAFCEFDDPVSTDAAIGGLNGKTILPKRSLTVKRAVAAQPEPLPAQLSPQAQSRASSASHTRTALPQAAPVQGVPPSQLRPRLNQAEAAGAEAAQSQGLRAGLAQALPQAQGLAQSQGPRAGPSQSPGLSHPQLRPSRSQSTQGLSHMPQSSQAMQTPIRPQGAYYLGERRMPEDARSSRPSSSTQQ